MEGLTLHRAGADALCLDKQGVKRSELAGHTGAHCSTNKSCAAWLRNHSSLWEECSTCTAGQSSEQTSGLQVATFSQFISATLDSSWENTASLGQQSQWDAPQYQCTYPARILHTEQQQMYVSPKQVLAASCLYFDCTTPHEIVYLMLTSKLCQMLEQKCLAIIWLGSLSLCPTAA